MSRSKASIPPSFHFIFGWYCLDEPGSFRLHFAQEIWRQRRQQSRTLKQNNKREHEEHEKKVQDPGLQLINQSISFLDDAMPHGSKSSLQLHSPLPIIRPFLDDSTLTHHPSSLDLMLHLPTQHQVLFDQAAQPSRSI